MVVAKERTTKPALVAGLIRILATAPTTRPEFAMVNTTLLVVETYAADLISMEIVPAEAGELYVREVPIAET